MFAIGYGIPPNGPLRAIRVNSTRLAGEVAAYLNGIGSVEKCEIVDGRGSLAMQAETSRVRSMGAL